MKGLRQRDRSSWADDRELSEKEGTFRAYLDLSPIKIVFESSIQSLPFNNATESRQRTSISNLDHGVE